MPTVAVGTFVLYLGLTYRQRSCRFAPSVQLAGFTRHAMLRATQRPPSTEVNSQGVGTGTRSDHAWVTWASRQAAPRAARRQMGRRTHVGKRQSQSWRHSTRGTYTSVTYPLGVSSQQATTARRRVSALLLPRRT